MIPEGMQDILPPEMAELQAIERGVRERFAAYGYGEVSVPVLEFAETFELLDDDTLEAGYRVFGEHGRQLMVRTDLTVGIVRMAASRYREKPLPLRFSYLASACRPWAPQRSQDGEFAQAGAELLGADSAAADAESVILLCDVLAALGLRGHRVVLGTLAFSAALVESFGIGGEDGRALLDALHDRDYPLLESILGNLDIDDEARRALQQTIEVSGTREVLAQARRLARTGPMREAVGRLETVRDLVADAGHDDVLVFDLGLFQDLNYYSGIVFEAYAPGVGLPIATGGRYDGLGAHFDWDVPGVGFALSVDRLRLALEEAGVAPPAPAPPLQFVGGLEQPEQASELRRGGLAVAALPADAEPPARPRLRGEHGRYELEPFEGEAVSGSWRDVLRALGLR